MSFGESFTKIRKEKGISRKDFAEQLGIPYTTLRNYEKDQREPGHKILIKMATLLSVSVDELIGHQVGAKPTELTRSEQSHIQKYRSLDSYGKEAVDNVLDVEYRRVEQAKENAKTEAAAEMPSAPQVSDRQESDTPPGDLESMTTEQLEALYEEQQYKKRASGSA